MSIAAVIVSGLDLSSTFKLKTKLPSAIVIGAKGTATVTIKNIGTTARKANSLKRSISPPIPPSAPDDIAIQSLKINGNLNPKGTITSTINFAFPAKVHDGTYYVIANLDTTGAGRDLNMDNNVSSVANSVTVAAPFIDLATTFSSIPVSIAGGGRRTLRSW